MKRLMTVVCVAALAGGTPWAAAAVVTFNPSDVVNAIGGLNDATYQWGLWAVRARPVVTGGSYTITGASTTQPGWGTEAPSSYAWNTYGTNSAWFYDESGSEAWLASNPLYMIMDVPQDNFESYTFDGAGGFVGSYSPGGGGTFYASGYNGGVGGTNLVTAVSSSSTFSFSFDLGSGATWDGTWQFLVDGSKYTLGTSSSPGVWQEDFYGDYTLIGGTPGGGLSGNMGSGYTIPEPASLIVWSVLGGLGVALGRWRRTRKAA
jgi:hypothetical protein